MSYYRQPDYYRSFQCVGGTCPNSCCSRWHIDWTKEEVDKLKTADCSPKLRELIEGNFVKSKSNDGMYEIKLKEEKHECPLLTENKLCQIQCELGADYLSSTCRIYPRKLFYSSNTMYRPCSIS